MELEGNLTAPLSGNATCHDPSVIMTVPDDYFGWYVFSAVLNAILAAVAFLGNALILVALTKASSLYVSARALYFSLAMSDLGVGLILQPAFVAYVIGGLTANSSLRCYARIAFGYASDHLIAVSYLTMTAISVDRFLALHLLMSYRTTVTLKRTVIAILVAWTVSLIIPVVRTYSIGLSHVFILVGFITCLAISSAANAFIYRKLHNHESELQKSTKRKRSMSLVQYKRSVNVLLIVYVAHLACYLPSMAITIAMAVLPSSEWLILLANFVGTLLLANSALNPFLYCWRARAVRRPALEALEKILCCPCGQHCKC